MRVPVTQKMLVDWAGAQVVRDADILVGRGAVLEASYEAPWIRGALSVGGRRFETSLRILEDGSCESGCPCRENVERGVICAHVIALGLSLVRRAADPERETKYREERRRAQRLASVPEDAYLRRVADGAAGSVPARLLLRLRQGWEQGWKAGRVGLRVEVGFLDQVCPVDNVRPRLPLSFTRQDDALLFVLEDICEGPARADVELGSADFVNVLQLCGGRDLLREGDEPLRVNEVRLSTYLKVSMEGDTGCLEVSAHTELPFVEAGSEPLYLVGTRRGWAYGADNLWPLEAILPEPYHAVYEGPIRVGRGDVLRFMKQELPVLAGHLRLETDLSEDLFAVDPAFPSFRLLLKGSGAAVAGRLTACYGGIEVPAGRADARGAFALPDPDDPLRYEVRNLGEETRALDALREAGLSEESGTALGAEQEEGVYRAVGVREVRNFLACGLPMLRRRGWRVEVEGRLEEVLEQADFAVPVVRVEEGGAGGWFEIGFVFEDGQGRSLSSADVQRALRKGESFLDMGGRTLLIDAGAVQAMQDVFADCASEDSDRAGRFRLSPLHAGFVKASLDALDGVDVEAGAGWRERAGRQNRAAAVTPVSLEGDLERLLRSYQRAGVDWLRFLEENGFCGILADEMGLGKTLQTLAWLSLPRTGDGGGRLPAMVVCPTSIVENWAEEAARFVPGLRVIPMTGQERHDRWGEIGQADLVITSYALLRRDVGQYLEQDFSVVVLDEAQHIKNRATRNAQAAKQLRARHRLVLTGTPLENSVADLWSIMDFLMPGYLGSHDHFRAHYEGPIARTGPEGETAQVKLRRKLHPFLMRRLKADVAKDLPPRIERVASCSLTADQQIVYNEILSRSRNRIGQMVSAQGFQRSRMEILTALTRLRQVCCHLGLLKLEGLRPEYPSGKMDLFLELLDEAMDAGHRVLVFSQFVSMLKILSAELDGRETPFCYLDGSTEDRMAVVRRFNTDRSVPVFLISLKAGGTGLNLTGADMVIHYDPWWNPAVEDQATDRAHRIGQKRTVYSVKLITRGTVEEKVRAMQERKQAVIRGVVDGGEAAGAVTWEDVQEILGL